MFNLSWNVDGHFIIAPDAFKARDEATRLYNYWPENVRRWTVGDDDALAADSADWEDDVQNISDSDSVEVGWKVLAADGSISIQTDFILTANQARAALRAIPRA